MLPWPIARCSRGCRSSRARSRGVEDELRSAARPPCSHDAVVEDERPRVEPAAGARLADPTAVDRQEMGTRSAVSAFQQINSRPQCQDPRIRWMIARHTTTAPHGRRASCRDRTIPAAPDAGASADTVYEEQDLDRHCEPLHRSAGTPAPPGSPTDPSPAAQRLRDSAAPAALDHAARAGGSHRRARRASRRRSQANWGTTPSKCVVATAELDPGADTRMHPFWWSGPVGCWRGCTWGAGHGG
jgi:hypothetical protein